MTKRPTVGDTTFGRWLVSYEASIVPAAMGPVAFGVAMLASTGSAQTGAALMAAMVVGQVSMAVPLEALTRGYRSKRILVLFLVIQATALACLTVAIHARSPLPLLIVLAAVSGAPIGLAFSLFRYLLAQSSSRHMMVRRIAISLTVNEVCYIVCPIAASMVAGRYPLMPMLLMVGSVLASAVLATRLVDPEPAGRQPSGNVFLRAVVPWLLSVFLSSAALAFVEAGTVAIALRIGWPAGVAGMIAAVSGLASGVAGSYVAYRSPKATPEWVFALMAMTVAGVVLIAVSTTGGLVMLGSVVIGLGVAPLGTFLSVLIQDEIPESRLSAAMTLYRAAHGLGIGAAALLLALLTVPVTGVVIAVAVAVIGTGCAMAVYRRRRYQPQ